MKKEINKIFIVLGFIVVLVGVMMSIVMNDTLFFANIIGSVYLAILLAATFVFATNSILKNIGYCLAVLVSIDAVFTLAFVADAPKDVDPIGLIVYAIGLLIMTAGAILYYLGIFLALCGFVKANKKMAGSKKSGVLLDQLIHYKEMHQESVLTDEEFADLKKTILENNDRKVDSIDDLKKWKKLLDQQVITDEEFSAIKSGIFNS